MSTVLKRARRAMREQAAKTKFSAWQIYARLDLGPGGYAQGPSTDTRATAARAIRERPRQ